MLVAYQVTVLKHSPVNQEALRKCRSNLSKHLEADLFLGLEGL